MCRAGAATSVLMITVDVELDTQAGWASVEHCQIKPFPMRDILAAVRTLLLSTAPVG